MPEKMKSLHGHNNGLGERVTEEMSRKNS